jgi:aspartyl/asparaginyl-tRNA synthetase
MKLARLSLFLVITASFLIGACDFVNKLSATKIKDILDHPRQYDQKEVTVYGTVTEGASLLVVKFFAIKDDTGTINVTTERTLPGQGEKLRVTGIVESVEIGSARMIVIREKNDANKKS